MGVYGCEICKYAYEFMVSNSYSRLISCRMDYCVRCKRLTEFRLLSCSGMHGKIPNKPVGFPTTPNATLWWRKQHFTGKHIAEPLSQICKADEK